MKNISEISLSIFNESIDKYHLKDDVSTPVENPYKYPELSYYLYAKNWIDTVQWHLEDIIRRPDIEPSKALEIKRQIDKSNQDRTDLVELIDSYFLDLYSKVQPKSTAKFNTESPAWAIDRLSILSLKIYHMRQETLRTDADASHLKACQDKLAILVTQEKDLCQAIDELMADIASGDKYIKTYKQMKMYNDPNLNPELYKK